MQTGHTFSVATTTVVLRAFHGLVLCAHVLCSSAWASAPAVLLGTVAAMHWHGVWWHPEADCDWAGAAATLHDLCKRAQLHFAGASPASGDDQQQQSRTQQEDERQSATATAAPCADGPMTPAEDDSSAADFTHHQQQRQQYQQQHQQRRKQPEQHREQQQPCDGACDGFRQPLSAPPQSSVPRPERAPIASVDGGLYSSSSNSSRSRVPLPKEQGAVGSTSSSRSPLGGVNGALGSSQAAYERQLLHWWQATTVAQLGALSGAQLWHPSQGAAPSQAVSQP
jgi:hypothetical protein